MKRKIVSVIVAMSFMAGCLTGCGGNANSTSETATLNIAYQYTEDLHI